MLDAIPRYLRACKHALGRLLGGCTALDAMEDSVVALEDDPNLNAGITLRTAACF